MRKVPKSHILSKKLPKRRLWGVLPAVLGLMTLGVMYAPAAVGAAAATPAAAKSAPFTIKPNASGGLDCNGFSPIQKTILGAATCTDPKGGTVNNKNTWGGRFYDNGHYIGHDEPNVGFFSNRAGSGDNVNWTYTLPKDPKAAPTVKTPGKDVSNWFELTVATWLGMALCDGNSYPQLPCTPESDANAPACFGVSCPQASYPGGGSAFLEMQFYPPGDAPFIENVSCNNTQWCASLHINEAECTFNFVSCNNNCRETTNFAFIQTNGVPTGPPSPQLMNNASAEPNAQTLLMNPGDKLQIHIVDAAAPGVPTAGIPPGKALELTIDDLTTGQTGFMQASAANGFAQTDIATCNGRLFNFQPEYRTSKPGNIVPWAAIQANVSSSIEIGHFTPCTSVSGLLGNGVGGNGDPVFSTCNGPYETTADTSEPQEAGMDTPCYPAGSTHGSLNSDPNPIANCTDLTAGDLDFDGSTYRTDYPTSGTINPTAINPGSFLLSQPTSSGHAYPQIKFQADIGLSELACNGTTGAGCTVPPTGSYVDQPGHTTFYPFWSVNFDGGCSFVFGNNTTGVKDFGMDAEYGKVMSATLGYPEFEGRLMANPC
jgi:hypothetical protein